MGPATHEACATACTHLGGLYLAEAGLRDAAEDPDRQAEVDRLRRDFVAECEDRCGRTSTSEHAACLASVGSLAEVRGCD
jgi:hypothetical protein